MSLGTFVLPDVPVIASDEGRKDKKDLIEMCLEIIVKGRVVLYTGLFWDQLVTPGDLIMRELLYMRQSSHIKL